jgi:ATP-dependent RNA helicase DeaD
MLAEKFADMTKEEILKRVAALEFNRFLSYYENAQDLNIRTADKGRREPMQQQDRNRDRGRQEFGGADRGRARSNDRGMERSSSDRGSRGAERGASGYTRLFVNLGTKDGFYKASFLQFILDMSDLRKEALGKIDMRDMNSWVEIESGAAKQMINAVDGKNYKGRRIRMNDADSGGPKGFSKREG